MAKYSKETYALMLDQLLEQELMFTSFSATEKNIKSAMVRVLGILIKNNILRRYANLVLDENLNVHVTIYDGLDGAEFNIVLYYGQ